MNNFKIVSVFLAPCLSVGLYAQEPADTSGSILNRLIELGEITIKASKDNVTNKSIPASVSVIPENLVASNEIKSLSGVTSTAPNFYMPDYGSKLTSPIYIRGIGSRINSPSVGLYVDYVPYFEKAAFNFDFFDIKRIEILKGPQGTLFGRNTMGGIVNILTTSPIDYQGNHISVSAGNYGNLSLNAGHYGKASGKMAYSLAGNIISRGGFHTNNYSGRKVDELFSYGLRNRIIYEVSDNLTVENIAAVEISRQGGYPYALFNDSTGLAGNISYNQYSFYDRDLFSDALIIRYAGAKIEVSSITSFQYLDDNQGIDQDFTADSLYFIDQDQKQNMLSHEIIIRSSGKKKYSWLFGAYAFFQAFDNSVNVSAYRQAMDYLKKYDHRITGQAVFHQSTLSDFIVKNLVLTAGIRVDAEKDALHYYYDRTLRGTYSVLEDTLYPSLNSFEVLPKVALSYGFGNYNVYGVIARGYKTGGFNSTFERPEDLTFDPESSWNYEAGLKSTFFNRKLSADLAVFYINWKNQQIYQTVPSGRGSMLKNAGHSVSRGIELTAAAQLPRGFDMLVTYGLTNAEFVDYKENELIDYSSNKLPYVPSNTFSVQATKTILLNDSKFIDLVKLNIVYRGNGDIYWNEENSRSQEYYGITDFKLSLGRGSFQADLWARNIFNTSYSAFYFEALGNSYAQPGKPMHFGMNMSVKF